jgi:UDP-N-acetylmuramate dehydrogenase
MSACGPAEVLPSGAGDVSAPGHGFSWDELLARRARRDVDLGPYTTIRIGGVARLFVEPADAGEAAAVLRAAAERGLTTRVLGGGSNLLVAAATLDGVVVHPVRLNRVEFGGSGVVAGAGVTLSSLIAKTTDAGLGGLETLAGIPGQVGGAVAMNAGGRFGEIGPAVEWVDLAMPDGRTQRASGSDLRFGYRQSQLPTGSMVVAVGLRLTAGERRQLKARAGAILKEKNAAQPTTAWNFGCMFKNPPGRSAGRLVESCGLKGLARGGARISPLHGNFVENLGAATSRDVLDLVETIEREVRERHGVSLEREVRVWTP